MALLRNAVRRMNVHLCEVEAGLPSDPFRAAGGQYRSSMANSGGMMDLGKALACQAIGGSTACVVPVCEGRSWSSRAGRRGSNSKAAILARHILARGTLSVGIALCAGEVVLSLLAQISALQRAIFDRSTHS